MWWWWRGRRGCFLPTFSHHARVLFCVLPFFLVPSFVHSFNILPNMAFSIILHSILPIQGHLGHCGVTLFSWAFVPPSSVLPTCLSGGLCCFISHYSLLGIACAFFFVAGEQHYTACSVHSGGEEEERDAREEAGYPTRARARALRACHLSPSSLTSAHLPFCTLSHLTLSNFFFLPPLISVPSPGRTGTGGSGEEE